MQIPRIDESDCISCGICALVCPEKVIEVHSVARVVKPQSCMDGCRECELNCPTLAIRIEKQ